jgi:hypothetical protein
MRHGKEAAEDVEETEAGTQTFHDGTFTEHRQTNRCKVGVKSGLRAAGSFGSFRALLEVRP